MTPTEGLLSSLLAEEAATITAESLRPLTGPADGEELRGSGMRHFAQRRLRLLAAVAAAVSVLIVIGLLVVARSLVTAAAPFADLGTATSPPRYYVEIDLNDNIIVQSTSTGRRTGLVSPPFGIHGNSNADAAVAVSTDGRTFVAAYNDWANLRTSLFRFTVTSDGQVSGFSLVRTGRLPGLTEPSLAISPDGTRLALAGIQDASPAGATGPPRLLVVNMRTGQVRTWHGLVGTGAADSIEDPTWTTNGSLRFLVMRCDAARAIPYNATCEGGSAGDIGPPAGAEWVLNAPLSSAALGSGRVLVRLPGVTVQVQGGPSVDSVTALQLLHSGGIRIARYDVRSGRVLQILYRGRGDWKSNYFYAGLAADGSGRYLLVNEDLGTFFGWVGDGRFHMLPIHAPHGNNEIVAASW
jgi:hypothetical protein